MSSQVNLEVPQIGTEGNLIVRSKRGRALKVGRSDQVEMFAQILNIQR